MPATLIGTDGVYCKWLPNDIQVVDNFTLKELGIPFNSTPFLMIQCLRNRINSTLRKKNSAGTFERASIRVSSGYRTKEKHLQIYEGRGRPAPELSHHLHFDDRPWSAVDFKVDYKTHDKLTHMEEYECIEQTLADMAIPGGCYNIGNGYWHLDCRDKKWRGQIK